MALGGWARNQWVGDAGRILWDSKAAVGRAWSDPDVAHQHSAQHGSNLLGQDKTAIGILELLLLLPDCEVAALLNACFLIWKVRMILVFSTKCYCENWVSYTSSVLAGIVVHTHNPSTLGSEGEDVDFEARLGIGKLSQNQTKPC